MQERLAELLEQFSTEQAMIERIAELEAFIREEYEGLLRSVCSVVDGVPDRSRVDHMSLDTVLAYEAVLRIGPKT